MSLVNIKYLMNTNFATKDKMINPEKNFFQLQKK